MHIARIRHKRMTRIVGLEKDRLVPALGDGPSMRAFIEQAVDSSSPESLFDPSRSIPRDGDLTLAAPIDDPGKIVAIGLNYTDHATESKVAVPDHPLVFVKFPSSILGPDEPIWWSAGVTEAVNYEAELAVVIGRRGYRVDEADALSHVFGYTCLNDVSSRDLQFADGQWVRAKSPDWAVDRHT